MVFNETIFLGLQSSSQEVSTEEFISMSLFNDNNSSLNPQSQPMVSTPTFFLAPNPTLSSSSISTSMDCNHDNLHPKKLFEDTSHLPSHTNLARDGVY